MHLINSCCILFFILWLCSFPFSPKILWPTSGRTNYPSSKIEIFEPLQQIFHLFPILEELAMGRGVKAVNYCYKVLHHRHLRWFWLSLCLVSIRKETLRPLFCVGFGWNMTNFLFVLVKPKTFYHFRKLC